MVEMDALLDNAKGPHGERRFYPPGKHPAAARIVAAIKDLEALSATPRNDKSPRPLQCTSGSRGSRGPGSLGEA